MGLACKHTSSSLHQLFPRIILQLGHAPQGSQKAGQQPSLQAGQQLKGQSIAYFCHRQGFRPQPVSCSAREVLQNDCPQTLQVHVTCACPQAKC